MPTTPKATANISVMIGDDPLVKPIVNLPEMAEISLKMLSDCMEAYKARDVESAKAVCDEDDKVDALYDEVYKELLMIMIEDQRYDKGRDISDVGGP